MSRIVLWACALALPASASAGDLEQLLSYIDVPLSAPALTAAGADAAALGAIARDATRLPYVRMRAASALGLFPGPASQATLTELALDDGTDREVRISALSALSFLAAPGIEASFTSVVRSDAPPAVREAAVRAVERLGPERARPTLQGLLPRLADRDPLRARVARGAQDSASLTGD